MSLYPYTPPFSRGTSWDAAMQLAMSPAGQYAINQTVRGARSAAGAARRLFSSRTSSGSGTGFVTAQHDVRTQYRRKRKVFKKRYSRKGRFVKRIKRWVRKRQFNTLGSRIVVRNESVGSTTDVGGTTKQTYVVGTLYGNKGTDYSWEKGNADCSVIYSNDADTATTSAKLYYTSARLDATLKNGENACEVDIYDIVYKGNSPTQSFDALKANAESAQEKINAGLSKVTLQGTRGVTLFDIPLLIQFGKIKILKKTKLFLPSNGTALYSFQDKKMRCYRPDDKLDLQGVAIPGWTRSMVCVHKAIDPTLNSSLTLGMTRTYKYKVALSNTVKDNII